MELWDWVVTKTATIQKGLLSLIYGQNQEKESSQDMSRWEARRSQDGNTMTTGIFYDRPFMLSEPGTANIATGRIEAEGERFKKSQYTGRLKEGDSSLVRANLDSAEQHFAAALKMVHVRDPSIQEYQREVEPLCKLGDVYSKRGQQTGDGGDFVKAAALYNAAIARSKDQVRNGNIATVIKEVERSFLERIIGINDNISEDDTKTCIHKKQLKEMRDQIKLEMETIDQQLDPYVHDEDDPCVKEIEAKRAQAVRQLFEKIAKQRKKFISLLVEECIGLMGPPPCKYALMGLGSQATGLVTPYSDLEFAILVERESEECLTYFRNLTHYLHLKVVNLGETILPAMGIKSLNDFYAENPLDDWYYDSVTPRGFAFDGSMPKASKTPLGLQRSMVGKPSELICTPENMASKLQNDVTLYLKEDYNLATILRNPCLLAGEQGLLDRYMRITMNVLQADGGKMAQRLAQDILAKNINSYNDKGLISLSRVDVKKELYRFPAAAVDCLALFACIRPTTVWKSIDELEKQKVISTNNAHHLTVLTSISAELRLRTYIANGGQRETLSPFPSLETALYERKSYLQSNNDHEAQTSTVTPVFHLPNKRQLFRYYYTAVPLVTLLYRRFGKNPFLDPLSDLYDSSPATQGMMYSQLCKFDLAIICYSKALKNAEHQINKLHLLIDLGNTWIRVGDNKKAISCIEKALQMPCRAIFGQSTVHAGIAYSNSTLGELLDKLAHDTNATRHVEQLLKVQAGIGKSLDIKHIGIYPLHILGDAWSSLGDHRKAIGYNEQALQICRNMSGETSDSQYIGVAVLNSLASAWERLGDYEKSTSYRDEELEIIKDLYGQKGAHPCMSTLLHNAGMVLSRSGELQKSIRYLEQALQMDKRYYGQSTAHPEIANALRDTGSVWSDLGDYRKAISYYEQALQMWDNIYGPTKAQSDITSTLNNLGFACNELGDHRKALRCYEQAMQINMSLYGQETANVYIAESLNMLGQAWTFLGDHIKACSYHERALQMYRSVYGESTAHSAIAQALGALGLVWHNLGDYEKEISFYEQALQMYKGVLGQNKAHSGIAFVLNKMGNAWSSLGNYEKGLDYHEQALQMCRSIYGQSAERPAIACILNSIGMTWHDLGNYRKGLDYHEQALQVCRSIYGKSKAHPDIARLLNNLGLAWHHLGDYEKEISFYEQALQMCKSLYGQDKAHTDIADALNRLGKAWRSLDDHRKGLDYHRQALQMYKIIYGQSTAHPYIADSLVKIGDAWHLLGDQRKAISYFEQGLQMYKRIHGRDTAHLDVARIIDRIGHVLTCQGNHRRAVRYHEQTLRILKNHFGESTPHPSIIDSLIKVGEAWSHLGNEKEAMSYFPQVLHMCRALYGCPGDSELSDIVHLLKHLDSHKYKYTFI
ncbi:PREDICTED: uncharacterized protein LOC109472476 [Branchiostoma belcheri]|uniref:Uncharacterized protein LOC109472476 n=1 Tax=Branchiostoma belcheri TaxID=7741 RepID=A0A6P4ZDS5_BRABE|nr:PREDICTED: uncharacterized protein LOC109472476 [Branchiostoma belcheri]